ncbi:MAG: DUF1829 domain-containing protein [Acetobacter peroxydans]|jgi:hypothetical protein|nr:DUF1829 domain-containing protein [Acetobacter peroxydans]
MTEISQLVDGYWEWLRDKTALKTVGKWTEITTPYLDHHNDYIQIYARAEPEGYVLTDAGDTLADLEMSGCPVSRGEKRQEIFRTILNGFGVKEKNGELRITANRENFALRKHNLVQAILSVKDMFMLASPTVESVFLEDVASWLDASDVRYTPNVKLTGKTGFDHRFDFVIPKSKKASERIVQAINNPGKNSSTSLIMSWMDTAETRRISGHSDTRLYAILNDSSHKIPNTVLEALNSYWIDTIRWSQREKFMADLAA